jgi:beta-glucosidase
MKCAVLVVSGRPMLVGDRLGAIDALVASWLPGSEGAGVADVVFGERPFTGRLPMTWMRSMAQLPVNVGDAAYDPQFPFGWGLRTDSAKARLEAARAMGVTALDRLLGAPVFNADGSVALGAAVLLELRRIAPELESAPWAAADLVVSVARDLAQAAMLRDGIAAATSALSADAEHALYVSDMSAAIAKLSEIALTTTVVSGSVGGTVSPTLSLALGAPIEFGTFTPAVAREYNATTTANVISSAGDAALSVSDSGPFPGRLVNGAFALASPLQARDDGAFAALGASPLALHAWTGPVANEVRTLQFRQQIGASDPLRTGRYSKTLTFPLSTTQP